MLNCEAVRYLEDCVLSFDSQVSGRTRSIHSGDCASRIWTIHVCPVRTGVACKRERANAVKDAAAHAQRQHKNHN